jgi:hypothetical protein
VNKELETKLCNDFPAIYLSGEGLNGNGVIGFSFECGDGWFALLYELSSKIQKMIDEKKVTKFGVHQVKEKFASLRYYCSYEFKECEKEEEETLQKELRLYLTEAETKSEKTCETCGLPGKLRTDASWHSTACDEHWKSDKTIGTTPGWTVLGL